MSTSNPQPQLQPDLDEILANAKAKIVETMNATTVAPNSKEIELTYTGEYKDGDVVNVRINNFAGHPLYSGTIQGYNLHITNEIPYKRDVGTQISLLSYPEAKAAINQYALSLVREALGDSDGRSDTASIGGNQVGKLSESHHTYTCVGCGAYLASKYEALKHNCKIGE